MRAGEMWLNRTGKPRKAKPRGTHVRMLDANSSPPATMPVERSCKPWANRSRDRQFEAVASVHGVSEHYSAP